MKVLVGWIMAVMFALLLLWQLDWLPEMTVWGWIGWGVAACGFALAGWLLYWIADKMKGPWW